jgi:hypothetical protein
VLHHHATRVTRQKLRRFRGNARAIFEGTLTRRIRIRQDRRVDMDNYLIALARRARVETLMQGRLREQGQRIGLLLRHRGRFRGNVERRIEGLSAPLLVQGFAARIQGPHEDGTGLGCQRSSEDDHTVLILIHVECAARVTAPLLVRLRLAVHPTPAAHDTLDMLGGAGAPDCQQPLLGLGRGHTSQRANLGV